MKTNIKVSLIAHTPDPERVVAAAAKLCYSKTGASNLFEGLTEEKTASFLDMLSNLGHASPTEHASFTFAIEGVSRALLAQITRHRLASFSVQSQRYVRLEDFNYIIPPEIETDEHSKSLFMWEMTRQANEYLEFVKILQEKHKHTFIEQGMNEKEADRKASKLANEDARFVLPNACETKMVVTMNARSLNHFFNLRCCNRAQWEVHALADEMLKLVYPIAPHLFASAGSNCVSDGKCPEGNMTCGKCKEVQDKYKELKSNAI